MALLTQPEAWGPPGLDSAGSAALPFTSLLPGCLSALVANLNFEAEHVLSSNRWDTARA